MSELKSILKKQKSFKKRVFKKHSPKNAGSYEPRIVRFNEMNLVTVTFFLSEGPPPCWDPDHRDRDDPYGDGFVADESMTYDDLRGRAIIRYNTRHNRTNLGRGSIAESIIFHSTMKLNSGKFSLLHPFKSVRKMWLKHRYGDVF